MQQKLQLQGRGHRQNTEKSNNQNHGTQTKRCKGKMGKFDYGETLFRIHCSIQFFAPKYIMQKSKTQK